MDNELSEQQKRFIDYYIETGDEKKAAMRAGYQKVSGSRLLKSRRISESIKTRLAKMEDKRIANAKEVLIYLTAVMRGETPDDEGIDPSLKKSVSIKDQMKAAELLGRRYGIFANKSETETADSIDIKGDDELEE